MKALSLWQPWASAIALGAKTIETRSWSTSYRGPIAIHAAKRKVIGELEALQRSKISDFVGQMPWSLKLPFGAIVATAKLVDCVPSNSWKLHNMSSSNFYLGDFSPGRFAWLLEDVVALPEPIPYRGAQGLFEIPDEVLEVAP